MFLEEDRKNSVLIFYDFLIFNATFLSIWSNHLLIKKTRYSHTSNILNYILNISNLLMKLVILRQAFQYVSTVLKNRMSNGPRSTFTHVTRESFNIWVEFLPDYHEESSFKRYSGEAFAAAGRNARSPEAIRNKNYHHMWIPPWNGLSHDHFVFALLFLLLRWGPLLSSTFP